MNAIHDTNRKLWVDVLSSRAIILVVYGHEVQWWDEFFVYTSPIKIPLFFIISGYLFNIKGGDTKKFFCGLWNKIIIPYVLLALISAIIAIPLSGISSFLPSCLSIASGKSYWFMPCLIVGELLLFCIKKYSPNAFVGFIISVLLFAEGFFLVANNLLSFGMLNIALEIQIFLFIGTLFSQWEPIFSKIPNKVAIAFPFMYVGLCYIGGVFNLTCNFDPHIGNYGFLPYTMMVVLFGNIMLFTCANRIKKWPSSLVFIGQNTLVLYLWANWGKTVLFGIMRVIHLSKPEHSILFACVCVVSSVVFCSLCSLFMNKYAPVLTGRKNNMI